MRHLGLLLLSVLAAVIPFQASLASPYTVPGVVLAIDADPTGNKERIVGAIDECVSVGVGQPVDIDVVIPDPGVPSDRGIVAFALHLVYDPAVVWVSADGATEMLLAQAPGSSVLPIQDLKPDKNGLYMSWAVDFGASGIEPSGTSEIGPGVVSRITLLPQSVGTSDLVLSGVDIRDDEGVEIVVDSIQSATIVVGGPCKSQSDQDSGVDDDGNNGPKPTPSGQDNGVDDDGNNGLPEGPTDGANDEGDSPDPANGFPSGGSAPPPGGIVSAWFIFLGLIATLGGASLLVVSRIAFTGQTRRAFSRGQGGNSPSLIEDSEIPCQDANSLRDKRQ